MLSGLKGEVTVNGNRFKGEMPKPPLSEDQVAAVLTYVRNSFGNSGVIGEGDVQWMTAASGILHKEYHEKEFSKKGGMFQMVQLWVNLPAKDKVSKPKYQAITHNSMGIYKLQDEGGVVEIVAGEFKGDCGRAGETTQAWRGPPSYGAAPRRGQVPGPNRYPNMHFDA